MTKYSPGYDTPGREQRSEQEGVDLLLHETGWVSAVSPRVQHAKLHPAQRRGTVKSVCGKVIYRRELYRVVGNVDNLASRQNTEAKRHRTLPVCAECLKRIS